MLKRNLKLNILMNQVGSIIMHHEKFNVDIVVIGFVGLEQVGNRKQKRENW